MNSYWLSRTGSSEPEGPFTEAQLMSMWNSGVATAKAQICEEGEDVWRPLEELVRSADDFERKEAAAQRRREQGRKLARDQYEARKKSPGLALALSALLPFGGQIYCGAWKQIVLAGLLMAFIIAFFPLIIVWGFGCFVWLAMMADAVIGTKAYNQRLAAEMGVY